MAPKSYKVSAPGSMMIMGEHAVLSGYQAIVCAVKKRIYLELTPLSSTQIIITDTRLGTFTTTLQELKVEDPFKFVLCAIDVCKDKIQSGFTLEINAEFSSVLGLGSSAAVTVATIGIINHWLNLGFSDDEILKLAKQVLLNVQGAGSGADLAASLYGGVVAYSLDTLTKLPSIPDLTAIYCGYKTPTPEVIRLIQAQKIHDPVKFEGIYEKMNECALVAIDAIKRANWQVLGALFAIHHKLQRELGTSNADMEYLVTLLEEQPHIYGAKISGAGLGDCVIGLGTLADKISSLPTSMQQFLIEIETEGLLYASH